MATTRPRASGYKHIVLSKSGVALVEGTTTKVREVVLDFLAHGWSAEEIKWQHPYLSLAQIHAAFTYYYDHQDEINLEIEEDRTYAETMRAQAQPSCTREALLKRLRARSS